MEIPRNRPEIINPESFELGRVMLVDTDYESRSDLPHPERPAKAFRQLELVFMGTYDSLGEITWPNMSFYCRQNGRAYRIQGSLREHGQPRYENSGEIVEEDINPEVSGSRYLVMEYLSQDDRLEHDRVFAENITLLPKDLP